MWRRGLFVLLLSVSPHAFGQDQPPSIQPQTIGPQTIGPRAIGVIEFFGYAGVDLDRVRVALPFHEGDQFNPETAEEQVERARAAVRRVAGRPPTDIAVSCCDSQGNWTIHIGLSGKPLRFNPRPKGAARLPARIVNLYERAMNTILEAVQKGAAAEDQSRGYALSEYPPLRSIQLEMRDYAAGHEALVLQALRTSADDRQRAVAAMLLGYAPQSAPQIAALARASRDSSDTVRNNATRALFVLGASNPRLAARIPAGGFVELLLSGIWTDLNKASSLLASITLNRSAEVLARLRRGEVLARLIEIARWRTGHAEAARFILGRVAGIDEGRLQQLVAGGQVEAIISELRGK